MADAVIVDALRIPFSRSRPFTPEKDVYNSLRMDEQLANLINELIKRNKLNPTDIDDLLVGSALQMKENYMMGGRTVAMIAGLPVEVTTTAFERVCISGMAALFMGALEIENGYADTIIAGGIEHMTHVALDPRANPDLAMVSQKLFAEEAQAKYDMATGMSMGLTAEKLFSMTDCTREEMDEWSVGSHQKAAKAFADGFYAGEILPVEVVLESGEKKTVEMDLSIRADSNMEAMKELKPPFKEDGQITAGNSSPLNAGASSVLMMSDAKAKSLGLKPLAKIISMGWAGVSPSIMGAGPVPATEKALKRIDMKAEEIDYWEVNEAFAVVPIYLIKEMGVDPSKVNVKGGAIAIGHPLACSGPRITGGLARTLQSEGGKFGCATMCGGGGQGGTIILEKV